MTYDTIRYECDGPVAEIRFNRPHRLNAVVTEFYIELLDALERAEVNDRVRAIVLTGEGSAFCVGADLKEHAGGKRTEREKQTYIDLGFGVCERIYTHPKVVVAAVNGYALGAGAEMSCSADFVIMKEGAEIGFPEISIGTYVGGAVTETLPRLVGLARARELIFTGRRIGAAEAHAIGLAIETYPEEAFEEGVRKFLGRITAAAPVSMRFAKRHLNDAGQDHAARIAAEKEALLTCMGTNDWKEGVASFVERRPPVFIGR